MSNSQEPLVLFGRDDDVCKMLSSPCSIRRKICPHEQSVRQERDQCELSQPLQYTLRQPLAPIHKRAQGQQLT